MPEGQEEEGIDVVTAQVGMAFTIEIPSTPTTGYRWVAVPTEGVELVDDQLDVPTGGQPGDGGVHRFRFIARSTGRKALVFNLARPWESEPISRYTIDVTVE